MGELIKLSKSYISKTIEKDGLKVDIEVNSDNHGGWILEIVNEKWHPKVWGEIFPSANKAIQAGVRAIEEQGIETFVGNSEE
jgi:hypothetical protein